MGVKYLLDLLENRTIPNAVVEVDLLKVAKESVKNVAPTAMPASSRPPQKKGDAAIATSNKFCLVVDGECCLNRLYGGFFSDWVCGGQWNRMADFVDKLVTLAENANIELTVFFNGAIESQRMNEWIAQQKREYEKVNRVLNHVAKFGNAPANKLWIAPVGLRMGLRMMLRHKNVNVVSTIDDYRQEVIAYCRENNFHGIITDDAEYIAFDPPRLFSASKFKLKFKGTLESREFIISELTKELQLTNEKLCVLVALLGNYLLTDQDLRDVYKKAGIDLSNENNAESVVKKLAKFVNDVNTSNDLDEIVTQILGTDQDSRAAALKQSIQYYMDGTKDGFLKYRSVSSGKRANNTAGNASAGSDTASTSVINDKAVTNAVGDTDISQEPNLDTSKLASENANDSEKNPLNMYKEAQSCFINHAAGQEDSSSTTTEGSSDISVADNGLNVTCNSDTSSSCELPTTTAASDQLEKPKASATVAAATTTTTTKPKKDKPAPILPPVPHEVMRTVSERHSKGLMSPYIYQILSQGEIKLPVIIEDGKQIPNVYVFYKPIRQMVYAIVFNLHHHVYVASKNNTSVQVDIRIKEWIFDPIARTHKAEYVKAEPVGWRVPTIQRLWFGTTQDDKRRRLRAFLTCMRSDVQLLLNPEFVPQQLLVAAVVLRYIMSFPDKKVLRKPELDAFIVAVLSPEFNSPTFIQDLKIPQLSSRGVQLAALFMKGVEMAMLVNDACGAPIPWLMCCPWLFFDGRLFHYMFVKATSVKNLHELCDNRVGLVMRAERMRQAILEGLNVQFARPPLPSTLIPSAGVGPDFKSSPYSPHQQYHHNHHHQHQHHLSHPHGGRPPYIGQHRMGMPPSAAEVSSVPGLAGSAMRGGRGTGAAAGRGRRSLGGRLEVAGVVVGSWGANYNLSQPLSYESASMAATGANYRSPGGAHQPPHLPPPLRSHPHQSIKKKPIKKDKKMVGKGRGLGLTGGVSSSCGSSGSSNTTTNNSANNNNDDESKLNARTDPITTTPVSTITESELPNGDGDGDGSVGVKISSNEAHDSSVLCCDSTVIDDDRFEDVITNGAGGDGDGNGDVEAIKSVQDVSAPKSVPAEVNSK
ncbi:constitutive coactivator of PPAR-gamma-like protein 1 homolog isoform X3 [Planococcus citri]|uniref:constitutive coactivator of PPAR-gamma-like protein 1 homolog isoform X3 n=1 Tax=Planococcus citri TaxID=170843 RepID=UPI0031F8713B